MSVGGDRDGYEFGFVFCRKDSLWCRVGHFVSGVAQKEAKGGVLEHLFGGDTQSRFEQRDFDRLPEDAAGEKTSANVSLVPTR